MLEMVLSSRTNQHEQAGLVSRAVYTSAIEKQDDSIGALSTKERSRIRVESTKKRDKQDRCTEHKEGALQTERGTSGCHQTDVLLLGSESSSNQRRGKEPQEDTL